MRLLVAVKRVVDPNVRVAIRSDGSGVDTAGAKMSLNPFDEVAVEQAVRLKEAGLAKEVVLVCIGPAAAKETLRSGLALGADRGILVEAAGTELETLAVARLLAAVAQKESADIVLLGKQSVDNDAAQCGPMLAGLLDWPQAVFASALKLDGGRLLATCDTEDGAEELSLPLPCVVTADLRLAEPRYATLPNVMAARRKPLETLAAATLAAPEALAPRQRITRVDAVDTSRQATMVKDAAELAQRVRELRELMS